MPTYLVHGFRWPRAAIRIHIILFDLEDAAAEWIVAPASAITILNSFYTLYDFLPPSQPPVAPASTTTPPVPSLPEPPNAKSQKPIGGAAGAGARKGSDGKKKALKFNDWSVVKLLEQYDPDDESNPSQPYAYVADYIVPVTLSLDIGAEMEAYEEKQRAEVQPLLSPGIASPQPAASSNGTSGTASTSLSEREMKKKSRRFGWFEKLRDQLAKTESIGWYVVVCGDEERTAPDLSGLDIKVGQKGKAGEDELRPKIPKSTGMRGFFGKKDRRPSANTDDK
jgi:hypothetical protein